MIRLYRWLMALVIRPRYPHGCTQCTFLGHYHARDEFGTPDYDLYYCPQGVRPTVIARWGADGDYKSGLLFALPYVDVTGTSQPGIPELVEALRRAVARGLCDKHGRSITHRS